MALSCGRNRWSWRLRAGWGPHSFVFGEGRGQERKRGRARGPGGQLQGRDERSAKGWRDPGFAGAGVGFLCVRTQVPREAPAAGRAQCGRPHPVRSRAPRTPACRSIFGRKGAGWGARARPPGDRRGGGNTGPRPAPASEGDLALARIPTLASLFWCFGGLGVRGDGGALSVLTFFFSKPHCIG